MQQNLIFHESWTPLASRAGHTIVSHFWANPYFTLCHQKTLFGHIVAPGEMLKVLEIQDLDKPEGLCAKQNETNSSKILPRLFYFLVAIGSAKFCLHGGRGD